MNQETLSTFIARTMREKDISGYDIERRTNRRISQSYVNRIKNGTFTNPTASKLKAIARGLGVAESEIFAVASGADLGPSELAHARLEYMDGLYQRMDSAARRQADYLLEVLEREFDRLAD